jgi:hypothetical protein
MGKETIVTGHKENFETLQRAIKAGQVCLMDCTEKATGEHVAVICAINMVGSEYEMVPMARFFNGNPYDELIPPMTEEEA